MREISLRFAQYHINHRLAGFIAYRAQAPIAHEHTMCVFAEGRWWLIENGEFQVVDQGIVRQSDHPENWARAHSVTVDEKHPIVAKLFADQQHDNGPHPEGTRFVPVRGTLWVILDYPKARGRNEDPQ